MQAGAHLFGTHFTFGAAALGFIVPCTQRKSKVQPESTAVKLNIRVDAR